MGEAELPSAFPLIEWDAIEPVPAPANRSHNVDAAIAALRSAISKMADGPPAPFIPFFAQWKTIGRHYLNEWIDDLASTMNEASASMDAASSFSLGSQGARALEHSLWRLDASVDKFTKILALTLGTRVLRLNKSHNGVVFRPDRQHVARRLTQLAASTEHAKRLLELMEQLREHPARNLRNDVSHSLSPVGKLTPLAHFTIVYKSAGISQLPQARMLYTDSVPLDSKDMTPQAVWDRMVAAAVSEFELLLDAVSTAGDVVQVSGRLEPPPLVRYDLDTGVASVDSYRSSQ